MISVPSITSTLQDLFPSLAMAARWILGRQTGQEAPTAPEDCHFFRLPPELRVEIYQYILDDAESSLRLKLHGGANLRTLERRRKFRSGSGPPPKLALFHTCKLIHAEAEVMLWKRVPLIVEKLAFIHEVGINDIENANTIHRMALLKRLTSIVPPQKLQQIQRLKVTYHFDLMHLLGLEADAQQVKNTKLTKDFIPIRQLLTGVKRITVNPAYVRGSRALRNKSRSDQSTSSTDCIPIMKEHFLRLEEVSLVRPTGIQRVVVG